MSLKDQIKIMVVDDMATSRGLVINALQQIGIKNFTYEKDGKAAFTSLSKAPVHLVISDYNMPGMNGLQLLHALRSYKPTSRIGFIMLTGSAEMGLIEKAGKLGMNNYLKKPFDPPALKACIERVVGAL